MRIAILATPAKSCNQLNPKIQSTSSSDSKLINLSIDNTNFRFARIVSVTIYSNFSYWAIWIDHKYMVYLIKPHLSKSERNSQPLSVSRKPPC